MQTQFSCPCGQYSTVHETGTNLGQIAFQINSGAQDDRETTISIVNTRKNEMAVVYFSGPDSTYVKVDKKKSASIKLPTGTYRVVVHVYASLYPIMGGQQQFPKNGYTLTILDGPPPVMP